MVNVLANRQGGQRDLRPPGDDKFASITWDSSPAGLPVIRHRLTWVECDVERVEDGGDHHIVIGRARTLGEVLQDKPLLFYRGGYLSTEHPESTRRGGTQFLTWNGTDTWL